MGSAPESQDRHAAASARCRCGCQQKSAGDRGKWPHLHSCGGHHTDAAHKECRPETGKVWTGPRSLPDTRVGVDSHQTGGERLLFHDWLYPPTLKGPPMTIYEQSQPLCSKIDNILALSASFSFALTEHRMGRYRVHGDAVRAHRHHD